MSDFLKKIIKDIVQGVHLPKVQCERQISPFIEIFIESIIGNEYILLGSEFPIPASSNRENENFRSSNIDYLLYKKSDNSLRFIELKTDSNSFDLEQYDNYLGIIQSVKASSAKIMYDFLCSLRNEKYQYYKQIIDKKIDCSDWEKIKKCDLLYIAPENILKRQWGPLNRKAIDSIKFIHYNGLPQNITGQYADEWKIICENLLPLDEN